MKTKKEIITIAKKEIEKGNKVAIWDENSSIIGEIIKETQDIKKIYEYFPDCEELSILTLAKGQVYYWETNQGEGPGYGDYCSLRTIESIETITG